MALQRKPAPGQSAQPHDVETQAREGASAPGQALPHQGRIQQSFGRHDISGVKAHTDKESAGAIGAQAYAYGDDVVFGGAADMHTAAHEAAHVVQQKAGVSLKGGVGEAGDPHERHADKVADAVVGGKSAEPLLDEYAGSGGGGGGVQKKSVQRIDIPADIQAMSRQQCITEATALYGGASPWENRGLLDHKIDAANDMRTDLNRSDPQSFGEKFALAALTIAVAAGGAALAVAIPGAGAAAAIAGAGAVITALPGFFGGGENIIDATTFVSQYISAMRTGWPAGAARLATAMSTDANARSSLAAMRAAANAPEPMKQAQRNEILDAYVSATALARGPGGVAGMGPVSMDDATEGRLHLDGANINFSWGWGNNPRSATLEGVGLEKLRNFNLDRKIGDIKMPRTMNIMTPLGMTPVGRNPADATSLEGYASLDRSKWMMANFQMGRELDRDDMGYAEGSHDQGLIDNNWSAGVNKAWNQVLNLTPRQLGVSTVGN